MSANKLKKLVLGFFIWLSAVVTASYILGIMFAACTSRVGPCVQTQRFAWEAAAVPVFAGIFIGLMILWDMIIDE